MYPKPLYPQSLYPQYPQSLYPQYLQSLYPQYILPDQQLNYSQSLYPLYPQILYPQYLLQAHQLSQPQSLYPPGHTILNHVKSQPLTLVLLLSSPCATEHPVTQDPNICVVPQSLYPV